LIEANKPVYTRIGFVYKDDWSSIFDPPDAGAFQKKIFVPLVNFLNTIKVNGILINCEYIYNVSKIGYYNFILNRIFKFEYLNAM